MMFILVLLVIWVPPLLHDYVQTPSISRDLIEAARNFPSDVMLDELTHLHVQPSVEEKERIALAEKALNGRIEIPRSLKIHIPFEASDLEHTDPGSWLFIASFGVPRLLLSGYQASGRKEFLRAAEDLILGFASFERNAWFPKGLMWNDHAIAERMYVLAEFWKIYRKSPEFRPEVAQVILEHAARCSRMLAKPSHFTFRSNHGIMQNLAMWHGSLAFPSLPSFKEYRALALERLRGQMSFYVNDEGVILEHSPAYQKFGLEWLAETFWYMTTLGETVPTAWIENYKRAAEFYGQLRRPDGSLPLLGDTGAGADDSGVRVARLEEQGRSVRLDRQTDWGPPQPAALHPVAGYSIWWDGLTAWPDARQLSQTVVAWSHFPGHGHKHADELSVLLWAGGQNWWTNVGYWPYDVKGRTEATSWDGSNAPHLIGEDLGSRRKATLRGYGYTEGLSAIDMERLGPCAYLARRQVIKLKHNIWFVADRLSGAGGHRIAWSTSHSVRMEPGKIAGSYLLSGNEKSPTLTVFPLGSDGMRIREVKGSWQPFAGWEVAEGKPLPAPALIVEQPAAEAWTGVLWQLNGAGEEDIQLEGFPRLTWGQDATEWSIQLPTRGGEIEISRRENSISSRGGSRLISPIQLRLSVDTNLDEKVGQIQRNFAEMGKEYPPQVLLGYRSKLTWLLLLGFGVQEFFIFPFLKRQKNAREITLCLWVVGGILLAFFLDEIVNLYISCRLQGFWC